jgi:hypothetical protein
MVPNNPTWIWPESVVAAARWPHIFSPILSAGNPRDGGVGCRQLAYYCTYLSTAVRSTRSCMCSFRSPDDVHHQPHTVLWRSSCSLSLSLWPRGHWIGRQGRAPADALDRACMRTSTQSSSPPPVSQPIMPTIICGGHHIQIHT